MHREMKDSGVEWIGKIPNGWSVKRIKSLALSPNSIFIDGDWINSPDISGEGIRYLTTGNIGQGVFKEQGNGYITRETFTRLACTMVHAGDLVISRLNEPVGRACIIPDVYQECVVAVDNVIFRPDKNYNKKFLMYCMSSDRYAEFTSLLARGTTMHRISRIQLGNIAFPIPPLPEQTAIAEYLDNRCAAIDEIIAEAKATIEEYKAWKASVIFEAVTKGLDPNAEMKDSGVEWIGKMPKGWKICKLKWLCQNITDGSHFSPETTDEGYPYITAGDVSGKGLNYHNSKKISANAYNELQKTGCRPLEGDVLLVKDGATTGRVGLMTDNEPCVALSSVAIMRPAKNVNSCYLMYIMMSEILQFQIRKTMAGSAMPRTTLSKLINYVTISCPLSEQKIICDYLDEKCAAIDAIIAEKEALIADMESYKKSLIYECVTGKRKVC